MYEDGWRFEKFQADLVLRLTAGWRDPVEMANLGRELDLVPLNRQLDQWRLDGSLTRTLSRWVALRIW